MLSALGCLEIGVKWLYICFCVFKLVFTLFCKRFFRDSGMIGEGFRGVSGICYSPFFRLPEHAIRFLEFFFRILGVMPAFSIS